MDGEEISEDAAARYGDPDPPARSSGAAAAPATRVPSRYQYLLDLDEDLASAFGMRMRVAARSAVTAQVCNIPAGEFELEPLFADVAGGLGLLIVGGIVELDTEVGGRTASELIGEATCSCHGRAAATWSSSRAPGSRAPSFRRGSRSSTRTSPAGCGPGSRSRARWSSAACAAPWTLNVQRAATCHPRADVRVALLLWHLAERWGTVQPDGIHLSLPLTHRLIGRLVGAERPSVSHALSHSASADLVSRERDGLVLHGTAEHHLDALVEPRVAERGQGGAPAMSEAAASGHQPLIHVIWMTTWARLRRDTIAMTACHAPSLEDLLARAIPGMPGNRSL